jgi:Tol biopolymer transport system component/DNA-binding winged helix-turn-helix (wHTH) protein
VSLKLTNSFRVGEYEINRDLNQISLGEYVQIVEPKIMEVLYYLASNAEQVISRQELMDKLWPTKVSDGAISRVVGLLRKALKDNSESPEYIQTIAKKGYRLIAPVSLVEKVEAIELVKLTESKQLQNQLNDDLASNEIKVKKNAKTQYVFVGIFISIIVATFVLMFAKNTEENVINIQQPKFSQQTSEPGFEREASLSQDKNWLVYHHRKNADESYNLYLKIRSTQEIIQLTNSVFNDRVPAISADKSQIAFFSKGQNSCGLNILTLDKNAKPIKTKEVYKCGAIEHYSNLVFSKDNQSLFFTDRSASDVPYQIYQITLTTGKIDEITRRQDNYYGDNELALSPDGKKLVFFRNKYWGNNQVYIKNLETGEQKKIAELGFLSWNPSWTPDGKNILFSDNRTGGALKLLNVKTGNISTLYHSMQKIKSPELSFDGKSIVYAVETANVDLFKAKLSPDGIMSETKMLVSSSKFDSQPSYSSDGEHLLFLSDRNGMVQLWLQSATKLTVFESLPIDVGIDFYSWHPNGINVVVATNDKQLYLLDITQDNATKIEMDKQAAAYPYFSVNGSKLYFTSDKSGDWQLWSLDFNGSEFNQAVQITQSGGYQVKPNLKGDKLYFTKYRQSGLWQQDLSSLKETKIIDGVVRNAQFNICNNAIFYINDDNNNELLKVSLDSHTTSEIMTFSNNSRVRFDTFNNCESVIFSKWQNIESDIMMMSLSKELTR